MSVMRLHHAKPVERVGVLFAVKTLGDLWNIVLDGGPDPSTEKSRGMRPSPNYFGHLFPSYYHALPLSLRFVAIIIVIIVTIGRTRLQDEANVTMRVFLCIITATRYSINAYLLASALTSAGYSLSGSRTFPPDIFPSRN